MFWMVFVSFLKSEFFNIIIENLNYKGSLDELCCNSKKPYIEGHIPNSNRYAT